MARTDLHYRISQQIGDRITRGELRAGDHLPPEPELARQLGISRFTLRKALDTLAADGRVVRRRGLGTRVAEHGGVSSGGSLISYLGEIDTHLYADLFVALTRASQAAGMRIQVLEPDQIASYRPVVRRDGRDLVNHLVCAGGPAGQLERLPRDGHAIRVLAGVHRHCAAGFDYTIVADNGEALRQAVVRLAALGHRRIALALASFTDPDLPLPDLYRAAVLSSGLEWERVLACTGQVDGWAGQLTAQLAAGEPPTAVVCEMDFMAVHLFDAAKAIGLTVPEQLSVIGMYDTPWSQMLRPQLATIGFPLDLIARLAVASLAAGRPTAPRHVGVRGTLIERASLAPPRS